MSDIFIKQESGLGDILFCQKIAWLLYNQGHTIHWPIVNRYMHVQNYISPFNFYDWHTDYPFKEELNTIGNNIHSITKKDNIIVYPLGNSGNSGNIMQGKYDIAQTDIEDWQKYVMFTRNYEKENKLFYDVLKLTDNTEYCVSMNYISHPPTPIHIPVLSKYPTVFIDYYDGYHLFDWCKVLENATELYLEGSAIIYIAETLKLKAEQHDKMYLFSRDGHAHFNGLFKKPWIWRKETVK